MIEIEIDISNLPQYIGKNRNDRRDYTAQDVPLVLDWIAGQLPNTDEVIKVILTGKMPAWMCLSIGHYLEGVIDIFGYTTPVMPSPYIVYDLIQEREDEMNRLREE